MKKLLIIDHSRHNWFEVFENESLVVEQASASRIDFSANSSGELSLELSPELRPIDKTDQHLDRNFQPDFCLIKQMTPKLLYGLLYTGIPCINSSLAVYMNMERPIMFGGLVGIQKRIGKDKFPLIDQKFYPNHMQMNRSEAFPIVVKAGAAHAGYGKARIFDRQSYQDLVSILALNSDYATIEPYYEVEYDYRIQKIGSAYRGYKRISTNWKANIGSFMLEELPIEPHHKLWADECSNLFGGMDILALDVIHTKTGEDFIIELNDCLIGFPREYEDQSLQEIKTVVMDKINKK